MKSNTKAIRSGVGRALREAALWPSILFDMRHPRLAFLPYAHLQGSSLLRASQISKALKRKGWNSIVIPPHLDLGQRSRLLNFYKPDLVISQTCRHPLNRMEFLSGHRVVLDLDDADFLDPRLTGPMEIMAKEAVGVIAGSRFVRAWARTHNANTTVIWTGSQPIGGEWPPHHERARIVTWAQADPLSCRDEFSFVKDVILSAWKQGSRFTFRLYGWREDDAHESLRPLREEGVTFETLPPMPYRDFLLSLRDVAVGMSLASTAEARNFSSGRSFGKILGYLDAKAAVICNDAADHVLFFDEHSGVIADDKTTWVSELTALLDEPNRRQALSERAYEKFLNQLSLEAAAERTSGFLRRTLSICSDQRIPHADESKRWLSGTLSALARTAR